MPPHKKISQIICSLIKKYYLCAQRKIRLSLHKKQTITIPKMLQNAHLIYLAFMLA